MKRLTTAASFFFGICLALPGALPHASGQALAPIFFDDSPAVDDAISRAQELASLGNLEEAAAVVQTLLEEEASRASKVEENRWVSLRARVHDMLIQTPDLLSAYRGRVSSIARAAVDARLLQYAYTHYLLSPAGLDAALRIAERAHEQAAFATASRVLSELESHPDLEGDALRAAALIATRVADFAGKQSAASPTPDHVLQEAAESMRDRWRARAGMEPVSDRQVPALPDPELDLSPYDISPTLPDLPNILSRPIVSAQLSFLDDDSRLQLFRDPRASRRAARARNQALDQDAQLVWYASPTITPHVVLINDGVSIAALDRQTLEQRWRVSVQSVRGALSPGSTPGLDDLCTVIAHEGIAYAVSGLSLRREASDERVVVAIDIESGSVLWRTTISVMGDEALFGSVLRGRPLVHEGVLVMSAVKQLTDQRLVSVYLVGLDVKTGERIWTTNAGSVGAARWSWDVSSVDHPTATGGVVFRADTVGSIIAVDIATGRILWARAHPLPATTRTRSSAGFAENNAPVVIGQTVYVISPDRQSILALDRDTGEVLHEAPASTYGNPRYILRADDTLVFVRESGIVIQPANDFASSRSRFRLGTPPLMRGRVFVAGDALIAPTEAGVAVIPIDQERAIQISDSRVPDIQNAVDPANSQSLPYTFYALERPGILAAYDNQLITVDGSALHTYARWVDAEAFLAQRIQDAPDDADAAVAYVQLAAQAGAINAILPAVDRAIVALDANALGQRDVQPRRALFLVLLALTDPGVRLVASTGMPEAMPVATDVQIPPSVREQMISRLARVSSTPEQRAAYQLAAARNAARSANANGAVELAWAVLDQPETAHAMLHVDGNTVRARQAAIAVGVQRVLAQGPAVLEEINTAARIGTQQALNEVQSPHTLLEIARSYPLSADAIQLYTRASTLFSDAGKHAHAVHVLKEAIAQATVLRSIGIRPLQPLQQPGLPMQQQSAPEPDSIRARLAGMLATHGRLVESRMMLNDLDDVSYQIVIDEQSLSVQDALEEIAQRASRIAPTLPTLGSSLIIERTIPGVVVAQPLAGVSPEAPSRSVPALTTQLSRELLTQGQWAIALLEATPDQGMIRKWVTGPKHRAVYMTDQTLTGWAPTGDAGNRAPEALDKITLQGFALDDGSSRFVTKPIHEILPSVRGMQGSDLIDIDTVLRTGVPIREVLHYADEQTLLVARRDASFVAFDADGGEMLWARQSTPHVMHDVDVKHGLLAVIGSVYPSGKLYDERLSPERRSNMLQIFDLRDGTVLGELVLNAPAGWVRITEEALVVVGTSEGITAYQPFGADHVWTLSEDRLQDSTAAVSMPGVLLVRENFNRLTVIDPVRGTWGRNALSDAGTLDSGFGVITTRWLGSSFAVSTRKGTAVYSLAGQLLGLDAIPTSGDLLPAAFAQNSFFTAALTRDPDRDPSATLARFDLPSGEALDAFRIEPTSPLIHIRAVDGYLLLSSETETIIVKAQQPADPTP